MSSGGLVAWAISWAATPYGGVALFLNAVAESSFFPLPPDWDLCWVVSRDICSGSRGGRPLLQRIISGERIRFVERYYQKYDIRAVGIAGFTPIPYKAFTISAGSLPSI